MNKDYVLHTADKIRAAEPPMQPRLRSGEFAYGQSFTVSRHDCGTKTCIAGFVAINVRGLDKARHMPLNDLYSLVMERFDITHPDVLALCDNIAPARLSPTPATGAAVLEILTETGEVDWKAAYLRSGQTS